MPLVRSVVSLNDGFAITLSSGVVQTITSADLTPAQQAKTPAEVEVIANAALANRLPGGMFAAVHLTSVVPLQGVAIVSNNPITGTWWRDGP